MNLEEKKLALIDRLLKVGKEEVLKKYEELLIEAQLFTRTNESIKAIEDGETVSLDQFREGNLKWIKSSNTK